MLQNCYNIGRIAAIRQAKLGGIAGSSSKDVECKSCYFLSDGLTDKLYTCSLGTGCNSEAMQQEDTFKNFDFEETWIFLSESPYPYPTLRAVQHYNTYHYNTEEFAGGNGSLEAPYLIENKTQLNNIRKYRNACFKLIADIKFEEQDFDYDGEFYNDGYGWIPIGETESTGFLGILFGNNHTISGLKINRASDRASDDIAGLFGYNLGVIIDLNISETTMPKFFTICGNICAVNSGYINNCNNTNSVFVSEKPGTVVCVGGIAGENYGIVNYCCNESDFEFVRNFSYQGWSLHVGGITGTNCNVVSNCFNKGMITATEGHAGGIAGYTDNLFGFPADIDHCHNAGSIYGDYAGGIVGYHTTTIRCSYNTGEIRGKYTGGISGYNYSGNIYDCYNSGKIAGNTAGGISGYNNSSTISHCYNVGVTPDSLTGGGICGNNNGGTGTYCYYLDSALLGCGTGTQFGKRCTNEALKRQDTFERFDFKSTWFFEEYGGYSYPQLKKNRQTPAVLSITLLTTNTCLKTIENQVPDLSEVLVEITYSDTNKIITNATEKMLTELDLSKIGTQTIHLHYDNKKTTETIDIEVIPKSIASIAVTTPPKKITYVQGQPLNLSGGRLTIYYNNNTNEEVDLSEAHLSYPLEQTGTVTVTAEYKGFSATFSVTVNEKQIQSIDIIEPEKLSYIEGESLDLTGGKLQITYVSEDNYTERIPLTLDMISGYDPNDIGNQTLTVEYEGQKITFVVQVTAKSLTHIEVTKQPDKLLYIEGEDFDPTGMVVTAYYNNASSAPVTEYKLSGYDSAPGTKTITVTYEGMTAQFNVTVQAKSLTGIAVTALPKKTVYMDGEAFDPAGLEITAYYNNGTSEVVFDYQISGYSSTPGTKNITISYGSQHTMFHVYVLDFQAVEDMMISYSMAMQSVYSNPADWQTVCLDIPGKATAGNIDTLAMHCIMQDCYGGENSLDQYLQWDDTAGEYRYAIPIDVLLPMMEAMQIPAVSDCILLSDHYNSATGLYTISEPGDYGGYALRREYMQVEREEDHWIITYDDPMTGDTDDMTPPMAIRRFQLELTDDYHIFTLSVPLKLVGLSVISEEPVVMLEGQELDRTKFEVHYDYDNEFYKIITDYSLSGYDSTPGSKTVTVSYDGLIAQFDVTVKAKSLTRIAVTARPDKISYLEDKDTFDTTGGKVTLYYNNGTSEVIDLTSEMVTGFNNTQVGKQMLTVTYEGFADTFEVEILAKKLSAIKLTTLPTKLVYTKKYEVFDPTGGKVTLYYNNGTSEVIDLTAEMVNGFDNTQVGKQAITVAYGGFTYTFKIEVIAYLPGDTDEDNEVTIDDVSYLLNYVYFPELYPVRQECDFNDDSLVNIDDVAYLLNHVYFPDLYPLQ